MPVRAYPLSTQLEPVAGPDPESFYVATFKSLVNALFEVFKPWFWNEKHIASCICQQGSAQSTLFP
jgi:hypothetical protein